MASKKYTSKNNGCPEMVLVCFGQIACCFPMLFPNVVSMSQCDQTKYWWVSFVTTCAYRMFSCSCVLCLQCTVGFKFDSKWVANINRGRTFVHLVICFLQCFPNHPFHPNHMGTKQTKTNRPIDIKNSQRIQFQLLGFHIASEPGGL